MPRRFSWENFSSSFIRSIVLSDKNKGLKPSNDNDDKDQFMPYILHICSRPDSDFVKKFRAEIEENFIFENDAALEFVRRNMPGNKHSGLKRTELVEMLRNRRLSPELAALYSTILKKHGKVESTNGDSYSKFHQPLEIDLNAIPGKDIPLYDYQVEAVSKLAKAFIEEDARSGFLVMPTGSGKTRTTVYFLLRQMIRSDYQVIWLTHRALLVDQPAQTIYDMSPLLNLDGKVKGTLRISCVSGEHSTIKDVDKEDDIVILMVPSASRGVDYIPTFLKEKVIVVVDEAHHTYAASYKKVIEVIRGCRPEAKLLGLTATPVRMNNDEDKSLKNYYDNKIIYQIPMSNLISKGVLAQPCHMAVTTNYLVETTKEDRSYINKWGELPSRLVDRIAKSKKRNKIIVDTYLQNTKKGDKTLIFAMNQIHAYTLCNDLRKAGVRADYVSSGQSQNDAKIEMFKKGDIDVLININILTEGSDIPEVNSVYLTRPTQSDVLLMQMIGRGMRGKGVGGKEKVNIVDFVDKWDRVIIWLNPEFVLNSELVEVAERKVAAPREKVSINWSTIAAIYEDMTMSSFNQEPVHITLPYGWYQLVNDEGLDTSVLVFADQFNGYQRFQEEYQKYTKGTFKALQISKKYWNNFEYLPNLNELDMILDYIKYYGNFPPFFKFSEREAIDPALIALEAKSANSGVNDLDAKLESTYKEHKAIIDSIYASFTSYCKLVYNFLHYKRGIIPLGVPIKEVDRVLLPYDTEPYHDLNKLALKAYEIFRAGYKKAPKTIPDISWTEKPMEKYYGHYKEGRIEINSLLNSKQVPEDAIIYVIYHELLHHRQYLTNYLESNDHDDKFRKWEHEFPDYVKHEQFLDGKFKYFDTKISL